MLVYIIVIVAAVLGLVGCYRAFGGGQGRPPDAELLLSTAHQSLRRSLASLDLVIDAGRSPAAIPETASHDGREALGAAQHCIDLLPGGEGPDGPQQTARGLLMHAIEDIGWAWRLVASPTWADNGGLRTAVISLRDDARRCRDDAAPLLSAPVAEPVEGS